MNSSLPLLGDKQLSFLCLRTSKTSSLGGGGGGGCFMSAKLIYVLSSFRMLFCAFYIHIHVKLITFPLNLVL